jgi:hypothetical protein
MYMRNTPARIRQQDEREARSEVGPGGCELADDGGQAVELAEREVGRLGDGGDLRCALRRAGIPPA